MGLCTHLLRVLLSSRKDEANARHVSTFTLESKREGSKGGFIYLRAVGEGVLPCGLQGPSSPNMHLYGETMENSHELHMVSWSL